MEEIGYNDLPHALKIAAERFLNTSSCEIFDDYNVFYFKYNERYFCKISYDGFCLGACELRIQTDQLKLF